MEGRRVRTPNVPLLLATFPQLPRGLAGWPQQLGASDTLRVRTHAGGVGAGAPLWAPAAQEGCFAISGMLRGGRAVGG